MPRIQQPLYIVYEDNNESVPDSVLCVHDSESGARICIDERKIKRPSQKLKIFPIRLTRS